MRPPELPVAHGVERPQVEGQHLCASTIIVLMTKCGVHT